MKKLTLLRHAKSGWDDKVARDFDRPLNMKGQRAAEAVGRHLHGLTLHFDYVLASPALRVEETLQWVERGYRDALHPRWDRRLYLASPATLLDLVQEMPDEVESLLLVGHNPGLEELVLLLVPDRKGDALRDHVEEKFPTASVAEMQFEVAAWKDVAPGGAKLERFIRPRDLDPAFGPDQG